MKRCQGSRRHHRSEWNGNLYWPFRYLAWKQCTCMVWGNFRHRREDDNLILVRFTPPNEGAKPRSANRNDHMRGGGIERHSGRETKSETPNLFTKRIKNCPSSYWDEFTMVRVHLFWKFAQIYGIVLHLSPRWHQSINLLTNISSD